MDRWHWMQFETNMSLRRELALEEVQRERQARAAQRDEERPPAVQMHRPRFWVMLFGHTAHWAK